MSERRVLMIAGPNGAGRTTFARAVLPQEAHCPRCINADLIAAGLSPFDPEAHAAAPKIQVGRLLVFPPSQSISIVMMILITGKIPLV